MKRRPERLPDLLVLSAPSGSGKTSLARVLVSGPGRFVFSVSTTTRPPRAGEREGVDYRFVDEAAFRGLRVSGELLEWAQVHGHWYGTPRSNVDAARASGDNLLLDVDVQGALQLRDAGTEAILVFVLPPSAGVMVERLAGRGSERERELRRRLRTAVDELEEIGRFHRVVVNDDLDRCAREIEDIAGGADAGISPREAALRAGELRRELSSIVETNPRNRDLSDIPTARGAPNSELRREATK